MRLSDFRRMVEDEYGLAYGRVITRDLALSEFDGCSADEALARGCEPRAVWLSLARACDVPSSRWHGVARPGQRGN